MAIQKQAVISFNIKGDNTATTLDIDLERDQYEVLTNPEAGSGNTQLVNWLSADRTNKPVSAVNSTSRGGIAFTVSLAYPVLTLTFASAPSNAGDGVEVTLLF
jgi:hypothetical protein